MSSPFMLLITIRIYKTSKQIETLHYSTVTFIFQRQPVNNIFVKKSKTKIKFKNHNEFE